MSYLRDYQLAIKERIFDEWQRCRSLMVQMPTGTGKTRLLAAVIADMAKIGSGSQRRSYGPKDCPMVWIVAHRRELVEQIKDTVEQLIIKNTELRTDNQDPECADGCLSINTQQRDDGLNIRPVNGNRANSNLTAHNVNSGLSYADRIKVMSIQWLARHWDDMKDERPELIVIDEAHHALADSYTELWRRYPEARKLGMTATPCRMNGRGFTDLFDKLITWWSIAEFIRRGYLSVFDYVSIRRESEEQRLINSLKKRASDGDYQIKEMNDKLNRLTSIEKLYDAMARYAPGKKGIVYAISIEHARNIAGYYSRRGVKAVAIDSRTPQATRKKTVDDFKAGKIKVMVNVDVFSEGFDCPDVEFVQMGRPTLSLAKYLQQVGRGLRMAEGKCTCMLIDNVGLYRVFGLPTKEHDWTAMFEGRMAGKALTERTHRRLAATAITGESGRIDTEELEMVMSHERLLTHIENERDRDRDREETTALTATKDRKSGLWALRRGRKITARAQYVNVFDIKDDMAAVRFGDMRVGVVDGSGKEIMRIDRYEGMKFVKHDFVAVADRKGHCFYIDMKTQRLYRERPEVMSFGDVEMLKMGRTLYSRTKRLYVNTQGVGRNELIWHGFYLEIPDSNAPEACRRAAMALNTGYETFACLLKDDTERAYWCCGRLADGSIVMADEEGHFYRTGSDLTRRRIDNGEGMEACMARLKAEAKEKARAERLRKETEERRKRLERLTAIADAKPFRNGAKWGLKSGERIVVPPKYRMIMPPVGLLCAYEDSAEQWGVMAIDGRVMIEARYMNVDISDNGTVKLTVIPGKVKVVKIGNTP